MPHPTPPQPNLRNCVFQKRAFHEHGFRSAGKNMHLHMSPFQLGKKMHLLWKFPSLTDVGPQSCCRVAF